MKTITMLLFLLMISFGKAKGQNTYNFSYSSDIYYEFSDGTELDHYVMCFGGLTPLPLDFDFPVYQFTHDTVFVSKYNAIFEPEESGPNMGIYPYLALFEANSTCHDFLNTSFRYKTVGLPGQRIFKYQVKNMAFEVNNTNSEFFSYQLWLYEGSGTIELRSGPSNVLNTTDHYYENLTGPIVGMLLLDEFNSVILPGGILLQNQPQAPSAIYNPDLNVSIPALNYQPPSGMVYRFEHQTLGISENTSPLSKLKIFPNPSSNFIEVDLKESLNTTFTIANIEGKILHVGASPKIDISNLRNGVYFLKITTDTHVEELKFVKK